jgi:signal transduction histidine kinase
MAGSLTNSFVKRGVIVVDRTGRIDFANRAALELFACANLGELANALSTIELDGATGEPLEFCNSREKIHLEIAPCERGWVIVVHDAALCETLERCLRATSEMQARERMSATMLHDVKGPMHAMTLALDVLAKTLQSDANARQLHYIEAIRKDLARLQESVPSLLPQAHRPQELSEVDIAALVSDVVRMMRVEAAMREVTFKINGLQSTVLRAPPGDLKHAFASVLLCVLHSTPEGKQIDVKLSREAGWARLTIAAPDALDGQTPGDAIDVHVARQIVRGLGGELYVDSTRRYCFKLPLQDAIRSA